MEAPEKLPEYKYRNYHAFYGLGTEHTLLIKVSHSASPDSRDRNYTGQEYERNIWFMGAGVIIDLVSLYSVVGVLV